jgi:arylsulfatase A-like enzyme
MVSGGGRTDACWTDRWKYISRINDNQTYLYSLTSDPAELKNISAEYPEITERFESVIDAYRNRISVERHQVDISYDPEIQQRLADLGYK